MNVLGTWTSKGLPRPSWSNARGDVRMIQFKFLCRVLFVIFLIMACILLTCFVNGVDRIFRHIEYCVDAEV